MKPLILIVVLSALSSCLPLAQADVLYDALYRDISVLDTPYPSDRDDNVAIVSFIGGANLAGFSFDVQLSDDFMLEQPATITTITFDRGSHLALLPPEHMIEIFADVNGAPSEEPTAVAICSDYTAVEFAGDGAWGDTGIEPGHRITLNLGEDAIALDAGVWWISIVALTDDDLYPAVLIQFEHATLSEPHYRDGGVDHGNGFASWQEYFDWVPATMLNPIVRHTGDVAMRIEGVVGPSCPADFTEDGSLNFFDVSMFLSLFAAQDDRADMNRDGSHNFFDVSAFLTSFGQGCP